MSGLPGHGAKSVLIDGNWTMQGCDPLRSDPVCALALLMVGVLMVTSGHGHRAGHCGRTRSGDGGLTPVTMLGAWGSMATAMLAMACGFHARASHQCAADTQPSPGLAALGLWRRDDARCPPARLCAGHLSEPQLQLARIEFPAPVLGSVSFQPSEFIKWSMLGLLARCAVSAGERLKFWTGLVPLLAALGIARSS